MSQNKSISEKIVDLEKAGYSCKNPGIYTIESLWLDWYNGDGDFCDDNEPYNFENDTNL